MPTSEARNPTTARVLHRVTFPLFSLIEMKALTDITTYMSAVNSPASNAAGTRPHQLWCGRIESEAEIIDTAVTAAIDPRMASTGLFDLMTRSDSASLCCSFATNIRASRDSSTPAWSVPKNLRIVVLGVDVMSRKLLSGRTTNGTMMTVVIKIQNRIFASVGSIWA